MHYANGKEAKVGDLIVGKDVNNRPVAGIVVEAYPGSDTCNLIVQALRPEAQATATAARCLLADDVIAPKP